MYYVYIIESSLTDKYYIGYTNNLDSRWRSHKFFSSRKKSKLYDCIRKYGFDNFEMVLIQSFNTKQEALDYERSLISLDDDFCLNLVPGGEGGFNVVNIEEWKQKLSRSRQNHKPFLGKNHTEETKQKLRKPKQTKINDLG